MQLIKICIFLEENIDNARLQPVYVFNVGLSLRSPTVLRTSHLVGLRRLSPTYIECITGILKWKRYILNQIEAGYLPLYLFYLQN